MKYTCLCLPQYYFYYLFTFEAGISWYWSPPMTEKAFKKSLDQSHQSINLHRMSEDSHMILPKKVIFILCKLLPAAEGRETCCRGRE